MDNKDRYLIIGAIDDLLKEYCNYDDCFTEEEFELIASMRDEIFDTNSPKSIREGMVNLAHRLFEELKVTE